MSRFSRHAAFFILAFASASASLPSAQGAGSATRGASRASATGSKATGSKATGSKATATQIVGSQSAGAVTRKKPIVARPFKPGKKTALPVHWTIAGNTYLNISEYNDLKGGVMELLKRYPPDKFFFVGLGRDGAPVIAFLQALGGKDLAVNLPGTSNIGWSRSAGDDVAGQHIEAAIPKAIIQGERRIVMLDVTSSGKTPALFGPYMDRYLKAHGGRSNSLKIGFWNTNLQHNPTYGKMLTDWIDTSQYRDFQNYYGGKYEGGWTPQVGGPGIGEHQRHDMTTGPPPTATNPNFADFKKALLARMEQDPALDAFLAKLPGAGAQREPEAPPPPPKPWNPAITLAVKPARLPPTPAMSIKNPRFKEQAEKLAKREERNAKRVAKGKEPKVKEKSELEPETFDYLDPQEYGEIRDGALMMMQRHNPQTSYFVGVGRSSTALVAFMEGLGKDVATYLPADGLSKLAEKSTADTLDWNTKQQVFALFDTFIPKEARNTTRKIVLFQQSDTGVSLPYMQALVEEWLSQDGSPTKVASVALSTKKPADAGIDHLNISKAKELQQLGSGKYYAVAPYGYFRPGKTEATEVIGTDGKAVKRSAVYIKFQTTMQHLMSQDAAVQSALPSLKQGK